MRYFVLMIYALMLSGCATQERRLADAAALCKKIGFEEGTEKFKECQLQAYEADTSRRMAASAAASRNKSVFTQCTGSGNVVNCSSH